MWGDWRVPRIYTTGIDFVFIGSTFCYRITSINPVGIDIDGRGEIWKA